MTAKATAILVPIEMLCVCKKCLSLNLKEFSLRISLMSSPLCCWDRLFRLIVLFIILTDNIDSFFLGGVSVK